MKHKGRYLILCVVAVLFFGLVYMRVSALVNYPRHSALHRPHSITYVLGITAGKSTVESLEEKLGEGAVCVGGHPNGGRAWYLSKQYIWVYVDGFNYNKSGRVIDRVELSLHNLDIRNPITEEKIAIPSVTTDSETIGWLGCIMPGMTKAQVIKLTRGLPKPAAKRNTLVWPASSARKLFGNAKTAPYEVELTFDKGLLVAVDITTD